MKLLLLAIVVSCIVTSSVSGQKSKQNGTLEQSIRKLELAESDAVVRSDVAALEKLWAEDFTVNNPNNQVSKGSKEVVDRVRSGLLKYSSFVREIESVGFYGDTVIVMGLETIVPSGSSANAGKILRRRYTNIWMNRKGRWLLTARHANVICQN
ncbi:MAG: nuclear transport factor 2 family protein [Acidobacteriota bacterium]|nr:nuclear transport factor 2 family protein [Acidobacteriota bacterium]